MKVTNKYHNMLFYFAGFLLIADMIIGLCAASQLGIPHGKPSSWGPDQWNMINFLWKPVLLSSVLSIILALLCFLKKYIVFPIILAFAVYTSNVTIINIGEIFRYGFIYPIDNISGLVGLVEFIVGLIGTIIWISKLIRRKF